MDPVRLELTWPNKDKFLLVPKDDEGKPVWVSPSHPAAQEVRIATLGESVGEVPDPSSVLRAPSPARGDGIVLDQSSRHESEAARAVTTDPFMRHATRYSRSARRIVEALTTAWPSPIAGATIILPP